MALQRPLMKRNTPDEGSGKEEMAQRMEKELFEVLETYLDTTHNREFSFTMRLTQCEQLLGHVVSRARCTEPLSIAHLLTFVMSHKVRIVNEREAKDSTTGKAFHA